MCMHGWLDRKSSWCAVAEMGVRLAASTSGRVRTSAFLHVEVAQQDRRFGLRVSYCNSNQRGL